MASNDSGVDTSNDSIDSSLVFPSTSDFQSFFEKDNRLPPVEIKMKGATTPALSAAADSSDSSASKFALPSVSEHSKMPPDFIKPSRLPSCSYSLKIRLRNKSRHRLHSTFPNILSEANERKLRLAASTSNVELLTRLLEDGTNPNCSDVHKRSPLHLAACRGYTDIVSQLLKHGANPNIVDSLGNTPLHLAVISASSNNFNLVVRILLQNGASVHVLDRNAKNPLELAESKLRLMRSRHKTPTPELTKILEDMCLLIALILRHFCKQKKDIDDLSALEERLQNLSTKDQVANEADSLLASVERLSINK